MGKCKNINPLKIGGVDDNSVTCKDVRNAFKSKRIITSNCDDEARLIFSRSMNLAITSGFCMAEIIAEL